jgi:peptidoglycan/xylan/chitin deacetylase (PgdA/CDA1 family)
VGVLVTKTEATIFWDGGRSDEPISTSQPGVATPTIRSALRPAAVASHMAIVPASMTLLDYLAMIPSFPVRPAPVKISLPHAAGEAAVITHLPTDSKVAFITVDDGWWAEALTQNLIDQSGIPVTAFLITTAVKGTSETFFANLQSHGVVIEDHTVTHPDLTTLNLAGQEAEICSAAGQLGNWFGRRPLYLRPPYLSYNEVTLRAAWSCGIGAVVSANDSVANGVISYSDSAGKIDPGDIVVMHFEPDFAINFVNALRAIKAAGLTPAVLQDWITVS